MGGSNSKVTRVATAAATGGLSEVARYAKKQLAPPAPPTEEIAATPDPVAPDPVRAKRRRAQLGVGAGRSGTILTGPLGITGPPSQLGQAPGKQFLGY